MTGTWSFFSLATRVWKRASGIAMAIVVITSLGIAGVASIFGPLYSLVLAPLPLPQPNQVVHVGGRVPVFNVYTSTLIAPERFASIFDHFAVYAPASGAASQWRFRNQPQVTEVNAIGVSPDFFATVGVGSYLGRVLGSEDLKSPVVVISHRIWQSQFSGAADVVGASVEVGGTQRQIVGVMPQDLGFPADADAWLPIESVAYVSDGLETVARLQAGISAQQAAAVIDGMKRRLAGGVSGEVGVAGATVEPFQRYIVGDTRNTLWMLLAVAVLFLLLACIGVVNLLLAHGVRRRDEMMIRSALGATRRALVGQLLVEMSLLVAIAAVAAAWLSSVFGAWLLHHFVDVPVTTEVTWLRVAVICALVAMVTLVGGLAPSLYATRADVAGPVGKLAERASRPGVPIRDVLAAIQLTVALGMLVAAGFLWRSLRVQVDAPTGFAAGGVVTFRMLLPPTPERIAERAASSRGQNFLAMRAEMVRNRAFFRDFENALAALGSVTAIGALHPVPFTPFASQKAKVYTWASTGNARPGVDDPGSVRVMRGAVGSEGLDVLGIPLVEGQRFSPADIDGMYATELGRAVRSKLPGAPTPVLINQSLARHWWPGESAVGKHFNAGPLQVFVVTGVVGDFQWTSAVPRDRFALFEPFTGTGGVSVVARVRDGADTRKLSDEINLVARSLLTDVPPVELDRLDTVVGAGQRNVRIALMLLGGFASLSVLVASLGVYTSVTLMVASRVREMGIRMALGADRASIQKLLAGKVLRLLVAVPLGCLVGWVVARLLSHLLVGVDMTDVGVYAAASVVVVAALGVAAFVPVWRAGATDPLAVLRANRS